MWRASFPADQLPSGREALAHEYFLKQFLPQDFCDVQGTRSRLTACFSSVRGAQGEKKNQITFVFSPQTSSSLHDFFGLWKWSGSSPTPFAFSTLTKTFTEWTEEPRQTVHTVPVLFSRNAPERQSLQRTVALGLQEHFDVCDPIHSVSLVCPADSQSKLKSKNQRGEKGNKQEILKIPSCSCRPWVSAAFLEKRSFLKQSYPTCSTARGGKRARKEEKLQSLQWKILTQSLSRPLVTLILIKWIWWNTAQLYTTLLRNWILLLKSARKPLLSKYWQFTSVNCIQTTPRQEGKEKWDRMGHPTFDSSSGPVCKSLLVSFVTHQGSNMASLAIL